MRSQIIVRFSIGYLLISILTVQVIAQHPPSPDRATTVTPLVTETANGVTVAATRDVKSYLIGAGDVIDINVVENPVLTRHGVRVDNRGMIQMPMIEDDVPVACRTEREVANLIRHHYREYMHDPQVYVAVKEFNSQPVAVIGAVTTPGRFQLQRQTRLLELLTLVNGPGNNAGRTVQVLRSTRAPACQDSVEPPQTASQPSSATSANTSIHDASPTPTAALTSTITTDTNAELVSYNLKDVLRGDTAANPIIYAGDIVMLPEADQVYVIGSVKSPQAIPLKQTVTLTQAVAIAGGALPDANTGKIRVQRQISGSSIKQELIFDLKDINRRRQEDVVLLANDVVDVPGPTLGRTLLRKMTEQTAGSLMLLPLQIIR